MASSMEKDVLIEKAASVAFTFRKKVRLTGEKTSREI